MVKLSEQTYCYNKYCVYQSCDRCACTGITIDATGRCTSYIPIPLTPAEIKEFKSRYYGADLADEETAYIVDRHQKPE